MKKSIAVIFSRMIVGGAEQALLQFLQAIDKDCYDVTLFTLNADGAYFDVIPKEVTVRFLECLSPATVLKDDLKALRLSRAIRSLYARVAVRFTKDGYKRFMFPMRTYPEIPDWFDCAIAYKLGCEDTAVLLTRIKAKKKCVFVHNTVADTTGFETLYHSLDSVSKIFCVSKHAQSALGSAFPFLLPKTEVFHNLMDTEKIRSQSLEPVDPPLKKTALVTVARLSPEKGQTLIPAAAKMLLDKGYDIYWYLVGDGALRDELVSQCKALGVENRVILLGTKLNPYPYVRACDIFVQTSFTEAFCTSTMEAKILCKPVVTTDAPGMREQFRSGENGLIVDAMTPEALAEGIATLLDSPELQEKFIQALEKESFDTNEMQLLYDLIEG